MHRLRYRDHQLHRRDFPGDRHLADHLGHLQLQSLDDHRVVRQSRHLLDDHREVQNLLDVRRLDDHRVDHQNLDDHRLVVVDVDHQDDRLQVVVVEVHLAHHHHDDHLQVRMDCYLVVVDEVLKRMDCYQDVDHLDVDHLVVDSVLVLAPLLV